MSKPKIIATRKMPPNVEARLVRDYDAVINATDEVYSDDELIARTAGHQGMLCCSSEKLTARVIQALPAELKIISTFSVGYEHIDVDAARFRGIVVTNTPDVLTDATADIAMLCLLGAARRGAQGDRLVRQNQWNSWYTTMMLGTHLGGKRLGVFGMGRIGQAVAQRGRGFGMIIHYHNRRRLEPELEAGAVYHADPESLLGQSQFLSINAPSTPETVKFFNEARLARLPRGAIVVNTSRGNLIDDEALIAALKTGQVAAAGLDVFEGEPSNIHPGYRDLENTFLLPHLGSATHETRDAMGFCCLDNLDAFFAGKPCPTAL